MKELAAYEHYVMNFLQALQKPAVLFPAVGISISLNSYHFAIFLLFGLLAADYVTGVYASWTEWRKLERPGSFWADREKGFTSDRNRLSIVKVVTYFLFILLSYVIEVVFRIKAFNIGWIDHELTITFVAMGISCAIEFYSIIFENLPRAGFSIWDKFKKITGTAKNAVSEIKDITNGNNNSPS